MTDTKPAPPPTIHFKPPYNLDGFFVTSGTTCGDYSYHAEATSDKDKVTCGRCKRTKAFKEAPDE